MPRFFFAYNHQGKADAYIQALTAHGWTQVRNPDQARFVLTDTDVRARFRPLQNYHRRGVAIFVYPHAARPNVFWDFPGVTVSPFLRAHFVPAAGHVEVLRAYGLPGDLQVVGWHLCPILPFRPRGQLRKILFAPIHPNGNGFLSRMDRDLNAATFRKLLGLAGNGVTLTVRYLRDLSQNGLWKVEGIEYIQGQPDQSYEQIDQADLVVSHQTFASIAIARGVPTLMMGEWLPPRWGGSEADFATVRSWDKYKDLLMYPLDILAEDDPCHLIERVIRSDDEIRDWKKRLIGEPFDGPLFVRTLESYL